MYFKNDFVFLSIKTCKINQNISMRLFVSLSFDGGRYSGWQIQKNADSVQSELEKALSIAFGEQISVTGAGRTDAGVNATDYIAHFDLSDSNSKNPRELIYKINAILPHYIHVKHFFSVSDDAHARFDAVSRTYKYYLHNVKDPFARFSYYYKFPLNIAAMNLAAESLIGTKDFSSFEKLRGGNKTSICTVTEACWTQSDESHFVYTVSANRFLRNMVRAMVGTLLEVGRGKMKPSEIASLLEEKDRCKAGQSVWGEALFLTQIQYPYPLISL